MRSEGTTEFQAHLSRLADEVTVEAELLLELLDEAPENPNRERAQAAALRRMTDLINQMASVSVH